MRAVTGPAAVPPLRQTDPLSHVLLLAAATEGCSNCSGPFLRNHHFVHAVGRGAVVASLRPALGGVYVRYARMCACACAARVRACVRARVCVRVCVCASGEREPVSCPWHRPAQCNRLPMADIYSVTRMRGFRLCKGRVPPGTRLPVLAPQADSLAPPPPQAPFLHRPAQPSCAQMMVSASSGYMTSHAVATAICIK